MSSIFSSTMKKTLKTMSAFKGSTNLILQAIQKYLSRDTLSLNNHLTLQYLRELPLSASNCMHMTY
jgi:hypothetical protein